MKARTCFVYLVVLTVFILSGFMEGCSCEEELAAIESYVEVYAAMDADEPDIDKRFDPVEKGIEFGDLQRSFTRTAFVYIENSGASKLTVKDAVISGDENSAYKLEGFKKDTGVMGNKETGFTVIFAPPGSGDFKADLKITTTDKATPEVTIKLSGEGVDVTVNDLDFGEVKIKNNEQGDIIVEHTHKSEIKISEIYFTDESSEMFSAALTNTRLVQKESELKEFEEIIPEGESFVITVNYFPLNHQEDNAQMIINVTEPDPVLLTATLHGSGVSPTVALKRDDTQSEALTDFYSTHEFDFGVVKEKENGSAPNPEMSFYILNIGDGDDDLEIQNVSWLDLNTQQPMEEDPGLKYSITAKPSEGTKLKAVALPENNLIDISTLSSDQYAKVTVDFDNSVRLETTRIINMIVETNDSINPRVQVNFMARVPSARIIRYPIGGYKIQIEGSDEDGDHQMDTLEQNFAFKACNAGEIPLVISSINMLLRQTNTEFIALDTNEYPYTVDVSGFPITLQPEATEEARAAVGSLNDCSNATDVLEFNVVGKSPEPKMYYRDTIDENGKLAIPVVIFESDDPNKPCDDIADAKFASDCPIPIRIQTIYQDTYEPKPKIVMHPMEGYEETIQGVQEKRYRFVACNSGDAHLSINAVKLYVEGNSDKYELMQAGEYPYTIDAPTTPATLAPESTKELQDEIAALGDCSNATNTFEFDIVGNFTATGQIFNEEVGKYSVPAVVIESSDPKTPCNVVIDPSFDKKCAMHIKITVE